MLVSRLDQIADVLGVTALDILNFGERVSNFFDRCTNSNVATGTNGSCHTNNYDERELRHQVEKLTLENRLLKAEKEKAELELGYLKQEQGLKDG